MKVLSTSACVLIALAWVGAVSAPSSNIEFVPHSHANRLAKHPTLPVLYLGLSSTPDSRNLVTFGLDANGAVLTNTFRSFDDFLTDDGKNPTNLHAISSLIVLPEEKTLLLSAQPNNVYQYQANTNAQHIAAIALDERGQPAKLLKSFRTTHNEASVFAMLFDANSRRVFVSYTTYWGWLSVGKNGVPSREFHLLRPPLNLWEFAALPMLGRLCGISEGNFCNIRLAPDGNVVDFLQISATGGSLASFQFSPILRKAYVLNGPDFRTMIVLSFDSEGRSVGMPRRFAIGESAFLRIDSKAHRLYSLKQGGTIRIHPLDAEGYPVGSAVALPLSCGTVRDVLVDEPSGKVYVACTEPPK